MIRRRSTPTHRSTRGLAAWLACTVLALGVSGSVGCATRSVDDRIINRYGLDVYLRSDKKPFGKATDHGYAHPSDISVERIQNILGALEIERRERATTVRAPAIQAEILTEVSSALAESFREADSSERIAVMVLRKQMQKKIFDRKFLTSFVTWMEGDDLVFHLSRTDWPVDENVKRTLPKPHVDDPQQKFRVVTNEYVRRSGRTGVAIAWRSDVFRDFSSAAAIRTAPAGEAANGSSGKTILMDSAPEELPEPEPLTNEQLQSLSVDDLRGLADLEEARAAGRITESEYRRKRKAIVDGAAAD